MPASEGKKSQTSAPQADPKVSAKDSGNRTKAASQVSRASSKSSVHTWRENVQPVPLVPGRNVPSRVSADAKQKPQTQAASQAGSSSAISSGRSSQRSGRSHRSRSHHTSALQPVPENEELVQPSHRQAEAPEPAAPSKTSSHRSGSSKHSGKRESSKSEERASSRNASEHGSTTASKHDGSASSRRSSHHNDEQSSGSANPASNHDRPAVHIVPPVLHGRHWPGGIVLGGARPGRHEQRIQYDIKVRDGKDTTRASVHVEERIPARKYK